MLKAVLPAIPVIGGLPGIKHGSSTVPELVLERRGVGTDPKHLERYNDVCEFTRGDTLPATYPHMAAFALHMSLMTDTAFPFAPMGLVHLRNSITQHRPIGVDETFDIAVTAADLRPHPKGRLVDLLTSASVDGELVWEEVTTLFARGRDGGDEAHGPAAGRRRGTRRRRALEAPRRPRPPLRRRVGRPQPHPPLPDHREGVRVPAQHRPRHVDQGAQRSLRCRTSCPTRSPSTSSSRSRSCCRARSSSAVAPTAASSPWVSRAPASRRPTSSAGSLPPDAWCNFWLHLVGGDPRCPHDRLSRA